MFFSAVKLGVLTWESMGLTPASRGQLMNYSLLPCWFHERERALGYNRRL